MLQKSLYTILLSLLVNLSIAQAPVCPSPYVYMDGGNFIRFYDPSQPVSANNPSNTNIPTFGGGLALMPNINGGTLSPTFYSVSGGNYWYWNGLQWVNTGHGTGNGSAVNIAGCGSYIYNLVGATGQIYVYDGTGTGTLLTTISNFNGGGPYDLQTDCNCNFYVLNTTTPNQSLTMYSSTGAPLCTYSLSGFPNSSAGGGFAIIGDYVYVRNNNSSPGGFYVGQISGGTVTFTTLTNFSPGPGDMAACPVCIPSGTITSAFAYGGVLGCTSATTNIMAYATGSNISYNWTGPGVTGSNTNSILTVSQVGNYTCVVSTGGCPPTQITLTTTVFNNSVTVPVAITPTGNICLGTGNTMPLVVQHTYSNDAIFWQGPSMVSSSTEDTLLINGPGVYTVQVVDPFTACSGQATVAVALSPTVALSVSDNSLCVFNTANSPNVVTITPSGANTYTLYTSSNFTTNTPNGPLMPCFPTPASGIIGNTATATLVGSTGFCTDTATTVFQIVPNPTVSLPAASYSICPGGSQTIIAQGANTYTWIGGSGLNTNNGATVVSTPVTTANYTVNGSANGCNSSFQFVQVVVMPLPTLAVTPSNTHICLGGTVGLIAASNANFITWSPASGLSSSNSPVPIASPLSSQIYTATANQNGCTTSATMQLQVSNPPNLSLSLGNYSVCAYNTNGSGIATTATATGAPFYTLSASGYVNINPPAGPNFNISTTGIQLQSPNTVTLTLEGENTVCRVSKTATLLVVPNPTISITPPTANICPGKTQTYVANGAQTYTWLPGTYTLVGNNTIKATALFNSYYNVVGAANGCFSDQKTSVLLINPIPTVAISKPVYTVCAGNTVLMLGNSNGTAFSWSPATGLQSTNLSSVTASPATSQQYTLTVNLNGCLNKAVTTVSVISNPLISASASEYTICKGSVSILNAFGAASYNWLPSKSLSQSTGNSVLASPNESTTYTLQGYNGVCTGSTAINITTLPLPDLSIAGSLPEICAGERLTITAKGAHQYYWQPDNTIFMNPGDSSVVAAPLINTNYTITGVNQMGSVTCVSQMAYSVIVHNYVVPKVSDSVSICPSEKVRLMCSGGTTYSWMPKSGLLSSTGATVVASPSVTTIYTVDASFNGACGGTGTVMVAVKPGPTVTASADTSYNLSETMVIRASSDGHIKWIQGEAIVCADCHETRVYATHDGCYVVMAENETGCLAYDDVCLKVTEEFTIYMPNTFSPNGDGLNDEFMVYGEHISDVKLSVYNRWGTRLFYSDDVTIGWDGSYNGKACKNDTYTWILSYKGLDRKTYNTSGHVILIGAE